MTLAIDTSSPRGSLALGPGTGPAAAVYQAFFRTGRGRGGEFFAALAAALQEAGSRGELEEIIVGLGPGSYSGVRLAVAAAAGLALSTGARLGGRPSATALETDAPEYLAVSDARQGYRYATAVRAGRCERGPELVDPPTLRDWIERLAGWPLLAGEPSPDLPGSVVCLPAAARLLRRPLEPAELARDDTLEPIYLRPPAVTLPKPRPVPTGPSPA